MSPSILLENANGQNLVSSASESSESVSPHTDLTDGPLEPLAVVGFSLRFPQEATTPEAFWSMLLEKRCAMTEWPGDRMNSEAFYHSDKNRSDTVSSNTANQA